MAALLIIGAMTVSCQSLVDDQQLANKDKVTLTATVSLPDGNGTKALTDPGDGTLKKTFATGDRISVRFKTKGGAWVKVVSEELNDGDIERDGKKARFTITLTAEQEPSKEDNYVTYIYPASIATADGMVINSSILSSQDGTLASLASNLDACINSANWDGSSTLPNLRLENEFAIGKFTFLNGASENINAQLTGVTIKVDNVDIDDRTYVITPPSGSSSFTSEPIYVALYRTNSYGATVTITATTATGTYNNANTIAITSEHPISPGKIYNISVKLPVVPTGAINGLFSVSSTKQVYFSQGNLQYTKSTSTWSFMEHQYNTVEINGYPYKDDYEDTDVVSLFGWATSGYDHGATCYQPYSTNGDNSNYYAYGNASYNLYDQTGKADWGYNAISNGGNTENSGWRTLTTAEWQYLFSGRTNASSFMEMLRLMIFMASLSCPTTRS
uniref:Uncharacterized protein n=1 Tax=uncultured bacterium G1 TaxID=1821258 RepID=A0A173DXM0_9BACT|nr:hypothetical protein [uncultured bacterium G1]